MQNLINTPLFIKIIGKEKIRAGKKILDPWEMVIARRKNFILSVERVLFFFASPKGRKSACVCVH